MSDLFPETFTGTFGGGDVVETPFVPPRDHVDVPSVAVWRFDTGMTWVKVGRVEDYSTLTFVPTWQDAGTWTVTVPWDTGAILLPGRIVTIDWRGVRSTWLIEEWHPNRGDSENGNRTPTLTVAGDNAKAMLKWELVWPDATNTLDAQPVYVDTKPAPFKASAETVCHIFIAENFVTRFGAPLNIPASRGRGSIVPARPNFDNLFEMVQTLAKDGGIDWTIGLENTTDTRAELWLRFFTSADKTRKVRLKSATKTIAAWDQLDSAPSATHAMVGYGPDLTGAQTTLAADINASTTSLTVSSSKNFPTPDASTPAFRVVIGNETLRVKSVAGKVWTVDRGVGSTVPESHDSGDAIRATRTYKEVTTSESLSAAAMWVPWPSGGIHTYVAGPDSSDQDEVQASGRAALSDGAESRALSLTLAERPGAQAFIDFNVSDTVAYEIETGAAGSAPVSSIGVTVDDSGITVTSTVGQPGNVNSTVRIARVIQALARKVRRLEKEG